MRSWSRLDEKSTGIRGAVVLLAVMLSDISLALVFVLIFFALGGIAFAYLVKGKN